MELVELGEMMMTRSERQLELTSQNITNVATPGYKRRVSFSAVVGARHEAATQTAPNIAPLSRPDFAQGAIRQTGRPLDLALSGAGFFQVRRDDGGLFYTRNGQFSRDSEGRVVTTEGYALQLAGGGDLVLDDDTIDIANDGAVLSHGSPVARIGVFAADNPDAVNGEGGSLFTAAEDAMHEVPSPLVRQGALEGANVDNAAEMMQMMAAMREAEAGARVVEFYDTLINQSIQTFGR